MPDDEIADINLYELHKLIKKKQSHMKLLHSVGKHTYVLNSRDLDCLDASQTLREQAAREAILSGS